MARATSEPGPQRRSRALAAARPPRSHPGWRNARGLVRHFGYRFDRRNHPKTICIAPGLERHQASNRKNPTASGGPAELITTQKRTASAGTVTTSFRRIMVVNFSSAH